MPNSVVCARSVPIHAFASSIVSASLDGLVEMAVLADGRSVLLRPIQPEDEAAHRVFAAKISREDSYLRFFQHLSPDGLHRLLFRFTHIDYEREMAFIAVTPDADEPETLGVVRAVRDADSGSAEFAVLVRSDLKGLGLGAILARKIIDYSRATGTRRLFGQILADNRRMLRLLRKLGFHLERVSSDTVEASLDLQGGAPEPTHVSAPVNQLPA